MGNGQKANMRREKNAEKAGKPAKSQLKTNEAAKSVMCTICRQTFLSTVREKSLQEHLDSKHADKTIKDCFPTWTA
ncbi:At2g23090 like protein [Cladochytrium replicatum]|nr:At2g23090 like protein [Cladochytrium replicatum]